jgi:polar amino acid transport system permease protein
MLELIRESGLYLLIGEYPAGPVGGLALTLMISLLAMALVLPAAIVVAVARTSGVRWLAFAMKAYVNAIRCVPILLLIFWVYLFLPVVLGFPLSGFTTLVVAIFVYQTAYMSEVIRAGIEALPKGQTEAARSLGLPYPVIVVKVILPQALYNVLPGILNVLTIVVKESSLGYMVGAGELTLTASHVNSLTLTKPFEVFAILAAMYFVVCYSIGRLAKYLEGRLGRHSLALAAPAEADARAA